MPISIIPAVKAPPLPPEVMRKPVYDTDENGVVDKAQAPRSGTAWPADAREGDMFYRSDLNAFYILIVE